MTFVEIAVGNLALRPQFRVPIGIIRSLLFVEEEAVIYG